MAVPWPTTPCPGDRVAVLGFTSVDYTTIDLALSLSGGVGAAADQRGDRQLRPDRDRNRAHRDRGERRLAARRRRVDPDRPRARRAGRLRLPPRGRRRARRPCRPLVLGWPTPQWWSRRWPTCSSAERRCARFRSANPSAEDALALLIYTSGSTGAPKGAMYLQHSVGKMWCRSARNWSGRAPRRSP